MSETGNLPQVRATDENGESVIPRASQHDIRRRLHGLRRADRSAEFDGCRFEDAFEGIAARLKARNGRKPPPSSA